jgi:hypothetical protein
VCHMCGTPVLGWASGLFSVVALAASLDSFPPCWLGCGKQGFRGDPSSEQDHLGALCCQNPMEDACLALLSPEQVCEPTRPLLVGREQVDHHSDLWTPKSEPGPGSQ